MLLLLLYYKMMGEAGKDNGMVYYNSVKGGGRGEEFRNFTNWTIILACYGYFEIN